MSAQSFAGLGLVATSLVNKGVRMKRLRNVIGSLLLSSAVIAPVGVLAQDKVLRVVPHTNLTVLDPFQGTIYISTYHAYMVFDTLFAMDAEGKIQPQMVESHDVSPDRKVWTFVLRSGLRFSDGAPVTGEDVVASLTRWGKKDLMGRTLFKYVSKLEAVNAMTVRMTLSEPFGLVLDALAKPLPMVPFIVPKRLADAPLDRAMPEIIGSGPFTFKADEYKPGERVVYLKNPNYVPRKEPASGLAGGKVVKVDRVEWVILKDPQTQLNALLTGAVDMIESPASEQLSVLRSNPNIELSDPLGGAMYTVRFNHLTPPFNNLKVRQAAMLALGQEPILRTQVVDRDSGKTCLSIYPCGTTYSSTKTGGWVSEKPQTDKAKLALESSGYDGQTIAVLQPTDIATLNKAPLVVAQLLRQAGFKVQLQSMDWASMASRRRNREPADKGGWNVFVTSHNSGALLDPVSHPILASGDKGYYGWAKDERVDTLRTEFEFAATEAERKSIAEEIQLRGLEQGILFPTGMRNIPIASRKEAVQGIVPSQAPVYWGITKR